MFGAKTIGLACMLLVLTGAGCAPRATANNSPPAQAQDASAHLIIRFDVKQDRLADFLPIMEGVGAAMTSEEGFIAARVYRNSDNPLSFTLVEEWESRALHQRHFEAINQSGAWADILDMLSREPDMSYNDVL